MIQIITTIIALFVICISSLPVQAEWNTGGSVKVYGLVAEESKIEADTPTKFASTALRIDLERQSPDSPLLQISVDLVERYQNREVVTANFDYRMNRDDLFAESWGSGEHWSGEFDVDRLALNWSGNSYDLTIGRQAIGFGRMTLFSPLDVIAPFAPDAIDTENRPGTDGLALNWYAWQSVELGLVAVRADDSDMNSYLGKGSMNYAGWDYLFLGGTLRDRECLGGGLAGDISGIGLKGEVLQCRGQVNDFNDQFTIAALEVWWHTESNIDLQLGYLYSGAGSNDPLTYPQVATSAAVQEGLIPFLGREYLLASLSYEFHPLVNGRLYSVYNLLDDSYQLQPLITLSLSDNLNATLFWSHYEGDEPEPHSILPVQLAQSEFGLYGDSGGCFVSWYF